MAPEQVRGAHAVGPAADIFSLGCVIYECLSGRRPLQSASITELFIKSASHEIPPITKLRSGVPPALAQLLHKMLDKNPAQRPPDGTALLRELEALGEGRAGESAASLAVPREPFAQIDQQLLSVILLCTLDLKPHTPSTLDEDGSQPETPLLSAALHEVLQRWGAFSERLSDDLCLITLTERGTAADLAMQACRLALQVSRLQPEATTILATGLGALYEGRVSGPVVERLLEFMHAQRASEFPSTAARGKVWLNALTAGLVDPEFMVRRVATGLFELTCARDYTTAVRPIADRLTPCVGRERELAALSALFRESVDESLARAVLLVAPYGRGKSRLRHELLSRVTASHPGLTLLIGRADPLSVGAGGSLLAECLRQLSRITPDDTPAQAEAKLGAALKRFLPDEQLQRCLLPLAQLTAQPLGLESPAQHSLSAAASLRDSVEQAFVQFLFTASAAGPVLLLLEDLHHADAMSVRVVQRALRELDERPFMVLALARPEVHSIFPRLWVEQRMQELRLEPLLPAAINQLIHYIMTPAQAAAATPYVLEHSCGNALFVEELILRALRDDSSWQLPSTLTTLELGRLLRLPSNALRVLRAASIFGMSFWEDKIYALLTPFMPAEHIALGLKTLLSDDLILRQRSGPSGQPAEFRFRQVLTLAAVTLLLKEHDYELGQDRSAHSSAG